MNKEVRVAIIEAFGSHPSRSQDWLIQQVAVKLNIQSLEVVRTLGLMQDIGEVEPIGIGVYRLTLRGTRANEPLYKKAMDYLFANWIAIAALLLSLFALLKK